MSHHPALAVLLLAAVIALPGCKGPAAESPAVEPAPAPPAAVTPSAPPVTAASSSLAAGLPNAEYLIETTASGKAPLKDGVYAEAIADSSSQNTVRLGPQVAYGDLDGTGTQDAAVILLADSGGSGTFTYLAAVLDQAGTLKPVASVFIGDRIIVQSVEVKGGKILVRWLDRTPSEPMSAPPSLETTRSYAVREGELVAAD